MTNNFGINDEEFIRGNVPMTKKEARVLTLSFLEPKDNSVIWDIGAGTGSISIEIARLCPNSKIFAVEKNDEAIDLIYQNMEKFNTPNIEIIKGDAPKSLYSLEKPDTIMVGGGGDELFDILSFCKDTIKKGGNIVANCITMESVLDSIGFLEKGGFEAIEAVSLSASRLSTLGKRHYFVPQNNIYIIKAKRS